MLYLHTYILFRRKIGKQSSCLHFSWSTPVARTRSSWPTCLLGEKRITFCKFSEPQGATKDRVRFGKSVSASRQHNLSSLSMEYGSIRTSQMWLSNKLLFFSQGAPIVLSDSEEEEMIILEPEKNPKKIR